MRRLAILTTGLARGGAEAQVVLLAREFRALGWPVIIYSMLPPEAHLEELDAAAIPVVDLGMRRGVPDPRALFRLAAHLRRFEPHILHCHMVHANLMGRLVRLLTRIPAVISTAHSTNEGPRWRDWAYKLTEPLNDLTTQVSRPGVTRYLRIGAAAPGKIVWVPNAVDCNRFQPRRELADSLRAQLGAGDRFVWIAVGNLRDPKDYPNLLAAFATLQRSPDSVLWIAGAGELEATLRDRAASLGIAGRIEWLGGRDDIARCLNAADAFVLSSKWEGMPMALLEAAACGLPAVATSVGSVGDIVVSGQSGYLVNPRDPAALSQAMQRMASLPAGERSRMGLAARSRVASLYSSEAIVGKWRNIYSQLLLRDPKRLHRRQLFKRALDLTGAALLLVFLLPLLALIALAVKLTSPGPVIFRQARLGQGANPFLLCKFRTMQWGAPDLRNPDGSAFAGSHDHRVTLLGRLLRKTSLDELPQLWNVLCGDMSLVGPRPDQVDQLQYYLPRELRKLDAKPGITGLAQISGRNRIRWEDRKRLDVEYVERQSLWLDFKILLKTIPYVLLRRDIHEEPNHDRSHAESGSSF